jgi:hypothetical protein
MGVGPIVEKYRAEILAELAAARAAHGQAGHGAAANGTRLPVLQGT